RAASALSRLKPRVLAEALEHGRTAPGRAAASRQVVARGPLVRAAHADPDPAVRLAAARRLVEPQLGRPDRSWHFVGTPNVPRTALISLVSTPDRAVAAVAAEALGRDEVHEAAGVLLERLRAAAAAPDGTAFLDSLAQALVRCDGHTAAQ